MTKDEMAGWHHGLDGRESGLTLPEISGNLNYTVLFSYFKIIHFHTMLN